MKIISTEKSYAHKCYAQQKLSAQKDHTDANHTYTNSYAQKDHQPKMIHRQWCHRLYALVQRLVVVALVSWVCQGIGWFVFPYILYVPPFLPYTQKPFALPPSESMPRPARCWTQVSPCPSSSPPKSLLMDHPLKLIWILLSSVYTNRTLLYPALSRREAWIERVCVPAEKCERAIKNEEEGCCEAQAVVRTRKSCQSRPQL